ncbi:MAG TPA: TolC family protein [Candidatus Acidoferrales bacterium]|nr:TolC family protein [Candidatus Acidoferrales bacterium]
MTQNCIRLAVVVYLIASLAAGVPTYAQAVSPQQGQSRPAAAVPQTPAAISYPSLLGLRNYSKGKRAFPNIFAPYTRQNIAHPVLTNAPTIYNLIQDGKLNISLQDAIALALQNNLDIAVSEYTPWIDQTNLLRTEGGGTPLGSFVLGGGGGGSFDPVISANTSISYVSQTVNNSLTSGVGTSAGAFTLATHNSQYNVSYTQELHTGTLFSVALDNSRSSSSSSQNFFNPAVTSSLFVGIQQPLLNGFGLLPNMRFILEARNNTQVGKLQFEEQIITSVTQVETQYWILVLDRQAVDLAKQTLADYQRLYDDDQRLLHIGTATPADVVFAESFIATGNQILIGAQANVQVQQAVLINLLTKDPSDSRLKGLELVPTTPLENAPQVPNISVDDAVKEAWADRPELKIDELTLKNDSVETRATKNALLPNLTLSGTYTSVGLSGNTPGAFITNGTFSPNIGTPIVDQNGNPVTFNGVPTFIGVPNGTIGAVVPGGISNAFSQIFHNRSPQYAATLNLNLPLRNRSAQAANAQAQLNERQEQTVHQRNRNTVFSNVTEAFAQVNLDAAQVNAAVKATQLAQQSYDYELKKFNFGNTTTFLVVQYASILNGAKLSELQAKTNFEIALATFNQALGRTLSANNITIAGNGSHGPDFLTRAPLIPGTIDGRVVGSEFAGGEMR